MAVAAALVIVSVCLLFGMARYAEQQFETEVSQVLTTDLLSEMNENATGAADSAAAETEKIISAYAGQLRIGSGRSYSIWDAATGDRLAGDENAVMTDNIVTAMGGGVGDAMPLLPTKMDVAVPITGESALILDIQDDGSSMRALMARLAVLLLAGLVLSLLAAAGISWGLAKSFSDCAAHTAQELRNATIKHWCRMAIGKQWRQRCMRRKKRTEGQRPHGTQYFAAVFAGRLCAVSGGRQGA